MGLRDSRANDCTKSVATEPCFFDRPVLLQQGWLFCFTFLPSAPLQQG